MKLCRFQNSEGQIRLGLMQNGTTVLDLTAAGIDRLATALEQHDPHRFLKKLSGSTFNVGGGREGSLSLLETTRLCSEITGRDLAVGSVPETRAGDVRSYISDTRRLFEHTDWRPARTPQTVMRDIFTWITENEDLVRTTL